MYPREYIRKHYKAFLLFAGACAVCLSLGMNMVILPWYDKQYGMKPKDVQVLGDDPSDNFFTETYPSIEGGFIRTAIIADKAIQFLKKHIGWRLEAYYSSAWHEVSGLDVKTTDSGNGNWKVTINFTASISPRARYRAFFGTDLPAKWFNIDTQNTTITLSHKAFGHDFKFIFNYSDLKQYVTRFPHLTFNNGFNGDLLWFSMTTTDQINKGVHVSLDPTYGLIGDAVTNSWEYDGEEGRYPDMIRLGTSEYYAIVSTGDSGTEDDGFIRTIRVWSNNGTIKTSLIDSYEYATDNAKWSAICLVSGDMYAIVSLNATTTRVFVKTISIDDADGQIAASVADYQTLSQVGVNTASKLRIMHLTGDIFVVAYCDTATDLYLETLTILSDGSISYIDNQEIDSVEGTFPGICAVDSDTVAVVYNPGAGQGNDGFMSTWNITSAGDIAATRSSFWEYDTANGVTPTIQKVTGNVYMVGYQTSSTDLYVKTCRINNSGSIWTVWKDTQAFDTTLGWYPTLFNVSYNAIPNKWIKGISFVGTGSDVWISTFDVNSTGYITSEIDTLTFGADTVAWYIPTCFVSGFFFLSIHEDASLDGWAKTFQIYANNPPTISNPSPANGATGIATTPQLSVNVSDYGDYLNATWSSNSSGSWHNFDWNRSISSYGAISDSVVNSWEYDAQEGFTPDAIKLGSDATYSYYAIVSTGDSGTEYDGYLRTMKVWNNNGTIKTSLVDSWEYDTDDSYSPNIVNVYDNIYAISYTDVGSSKQKVITVKIWNNNGTISKTIIDTLALTYNSASTFTDFERASMIRVNGNIFCVFYMNATYFDLNLETIWINDSGTINDTTLDIQSVALLTSTNGGQPFVADIDSNTIVTCYVYTSGENILRTWNISAVGDITNTYADTWTISTGITVNYMYIKNLINNIYVVAYISTYLRIGTITIASTGMFTKSVISWVYITNSKTNPFYTFISTLSNNLYAVTFQDASGDGILKTLKITDAGIIACFEYDVLEFDTADSIYYAPILPVANDYYLIVYEGTGNDGWSCTVKIGNDTSTTLKQTNANFSAAGTKYYWRVNVSDGVNANYSIYSFTTAGGEPNTCPTATNPYPANNSVNVNFQPQCHVTIADANGDAMDLNFYNSSNGITYYHRQANMSLANGTYYWTFDEASDALTTYYWKVTINDEICNSTYKYSFTTKEGAYVNLSGFSATYNLTWNGDLYYPNQYNKFCNNSGDAFETVQIDIDVEGKYGISDIMFWMSDMNKTTTGKIMGAKNCTVWVSTTGVIFARLNDNDGNGPGVFKAPYWGLWWNFTTSPAGIPNPFTYHFGGYWIDADTTLYARFQYNLSSTLETGTYYNDSDWYIDGYNATDYIAGSDHFNGKYVVTDTTPAERSWHTINDWNGSLYTVANWNTVADWNGSLYTSSAWQTTSEWNGSLYVSPSFHTVNDWNGSLYVSTAWNSVNDWNGSLYVLSAWHTTNDWNGSLYYSATFNTINDWNGSLYVNASWHTTNNWNGSLYTLSTWQTTNEWNGSLYVSTAWNTVNDWNGSLYAVYSWHTDYEWNGSLYTTEVGDNITISDPHPANNSINNPLNITLSITITNRLGYNMNITWYWGNSSANATHYLGSTLNVTNGTYYMHIQPANETFTDYWWNVNVDDGHSNYANAIYDFESSTKGLNVAMNARDRFTLGLVLGSMIFLMIGFVLFRKKKRKI